MNGIPSRTVLRGEAGRAEDMEGRSNIARNTADATIRRDILGQKGQSLEKETRQLFRNWKPIREEVVRLLKADDKQAAVRITKTDGADHVEMLEGKMLELTLYARNKAGGFIEHAAIMQSRLEKITLVLLISGVFVSLIIALTATTLVVKGERLLQKKNNKLQKIF